jgi:hypothetical protein
LLLVGPALAFAAHERFDAGTPREQLVARFDHMSEPALATAFLRCDREARTRVLSLDDGARCAMAWDALLRRVFAGDVDALIAWWKANRDEGTLD